MLLRVVITMLCGVGLYASLFMLAKTRRAELGLLERAQRRPEAARPASTAGVPNALLGGLYYPALAIAVWFGHGQIVSLIVLIIAGFAAADVGGARLLSALHHQAPVSVLLDRARSKLDSCYDSASSKRTYCLERSRLVECVSPVGAADFGSLAAENSGPGRVAVVPVSGERQ